MITRIIRKVQKNSKRRLKQKEDLKTSTLKEDFQNLKFRNLEEKVEEEL